MLKYGKDQMLRSRASKRASGGVKLIAVVQHVAMELIFLDQFVGCFEFTQGEPTSEY
jgi:hypothetical protein